MIARKMLLAAAVATVGAVGLAPQSASAGSVTFSTTGVFAPAIGDNVISFSGVSVPSLNVPEGGVLTSFGSFHAKNTDFNFDSNSTTFTLTITQTDPSVPPGDPNTVSATIVGKLIKNNPSTITISFDSTPLTLPASGLPSATYSQFQNVTLRTNDKDIALMGNITYNNVAAVPLPATVWGGMSLLGMLGAARLRKGRA